MLRATARPLRTGHCHPLHGSLCRVPGRGRSAGRALPGQSSLPCEIRGRHGTAGRAAGPAAAECEPRGSLCKLTPRITLPVSCACCGCRLRPTTLLLATGNDFPGHHERSPLLRVQRSRRLLRTTESTLKPCPEAEGTVCFPAAGVSSQ